MAVVVSWDGRFPGWLAQTLESITSQHPRPDERCLVIDDPDSGLDALTAAGLDAAAAGWTVCTGSWRDPSAARNRGLEATQAPWVTFWDSDNVMPPGFVRATVDACAHAAAGVGIVYPDLRYVDADLGHPSHWRVPDYDYWSLRAGNYIDTGSAWRREAVELAGNWPLGLGSFEDYSLALEITRRGWSAVRRAGPPIELRQHPGSRSNQRTRDGRRRADLFNCRRLGILTLLSGRTSTYERWENFLHTVRLPRHTSLYLVDNGGDPVFTERVRASEHDLAATGRFDRITVWTRPERYRGGEDEPYFVRERHLHIARLYADTMPAIKDDLILTLEDDVEPPPDAVERLIEQTGSEHWGNVGAVAAAYDMGTEYLCAGRDDGGWGSQIRWDELTDDAFEVGSVGGGCTLWANWAMAGQPVSFRWHDGLGWDGSLCRALRGRGYRIRLHGGVRCTHHVHGVVRSP